MTTRAERRSRRAREVVERNEQERREVRRQRWMDSLPVEFHDFDIKNDLLKDKWGGNLDIKSVKKIRDYLDDPHKFLLLRGQEGRGKSSLAATVATEIMERYDMTPGYASLPTLLYDFSYSGDPDLVSRLSSRGILVLDDMGAANEGITAHQKRMLWALIDNRWSNDLPTVITTNMAVSSNEDGVGIADWLEPSLWARVRDGLTMVSFGGDSFRG